jgi:gamma-glutamyltranspeptidase/glutathione hydrolase
MVQVLLNVLVFGMDVQTAVEAPRFATYSHPDSFEPHTYQPGVLKAEGRIPSSTLAALENLGHRVQKWKDWQWQAGGVCAIERKRSVLFGGADPRRENDAAGW